MTPSQMSQRARIAAYSRLANSTEEERRAMSERGRKSFMARFDDQVDPDRVLPEAERQKRAEYARKAYFARLAFKSAQTRAKKKRPQADA